MTDETANETSAETTAAAPRFVGGKPREKAIALDWPVECEGKVYDRVTVRRMTMSEVRTFTESVLAGNKDAPLPMFDVPRAVLDALDPDDDERLQEAANEFMPRRFRMEAAPENAAPGAAAAPSSPLRSARPVEQLQEHWNGVVGTDRQA